MRYRTFPKIPDLPISILGFGCMRLPFLDGDPARIDEARATRLLHEAIEGGVNYVDTAYPYHGGESEPFLGRALKGGYRRRVQLATKCPTWFVQAEGDWERFLDEQLRRLETDTVDFYLLHGLNGERWEIVKRLGGLRALDRARSDRPITYAGVDFVGAWGPWREDAADPQLAVLSVAEQKAAVALARATLATHLTHDGQLADWFASHQVTGNLAARAGVFVTINNLGAKAKKEGRLRGCIGVMEAHEPLVDAIVHAAVSAAHDPRFPELDSAELSEVGVEVSVLSPMRPVTGPEAIELGKHGVVLSKSGRRAVFLPQVATETKWDLATFLSQLSLKAGLPSDAWQSGATFEVFTAQVFHEEE